MLPKHAAADQVLDKEVLMMGQVGKKITDLEFEVFHKEDIKKVKLSDFEGKWLILVFYPADFTFVCPTELEELADLYEEFKKAGAEIISLAPIPHLCIKPGMIIHQL